MFKILVPVDDSENAGRVIEFVISLISKAKDTEIHLITVRDPMDSLEVRRFMTAEQIDALQQESGNLVLKAARKRLDEVGIPCTASIVIGEIAQTIAEYANERQFDMIVMGTRGKGTIGSLLMGSVATKVVHLTKIPVTLVK